MRKRKPFIIVIGSCLLIFIVVIAYWTILPRTGTLDIPGEGIYTGQLRGMTFHGYGTYTSYEITGASYEGQWKDGVFNGLGKLSFINGSQLVGEFVDGYIQGKGIMVCPEGHAREVNFSELRQLENDHSDCDHEH